MNAYVHGVWDDAFEPAIIDVTHHGVCFPTACLAICENSTIIAVENIPDCLTTNNFKYFTLRNERW